MLIKIGFELSFNIPAPVPMLLVLHVHPEQVHKLQYLEHLLVEPNVPVYTFIDGFGNRAARIAAPAGALRISYSNLVNDSGNPEPSIEGAYVHPVEELPPDILPFLLASRYCEVDRMTQTAWDLFGSIPLGWRRVQAVVDWAHNHIRFGYQYASPFKTAYDAYGEGRGVCRDYMHLAITMLCAMNIPARYATGYLGDIGVPQNPAPMDFSAYLEVYLSGTWWAMDARHNVRRIGRVKQAHGRDAVDVALTTSFGPSSLTGFKVVCEEA